MKFLEIMLILALAAITSALAESTTVWENVTYEDFAKGKLEATVLFSDGTIRTGNRVQAIQSPELSLWSLASDSEGNLYVGTGISGIVYRLEKGSLQKYCETGELIATALATDGKTLYAGTLPNGKVFRIQDGQKTLLAELPSRYIWAMKLYQQKLYIATGPDGVLYQMDLSSGQASVLAKTPEKHLLSLAMDSRQNLYTGSAPNAILYQVTRDGSVTALIDLPENEIRGLAVSDGNIYIGSNATEKFDNAAMVQNLAKKLQQQAEGKPLDRQKVLEEMLSGALYVYNSERGFEKLLDFPKDFVTSVAASGDKVLVSTGLNGKIYEIHNREMYSIVHDVKEEQIIAMAMSDGKLKYFGTGDTGMLYLVDFEFKSGEASYLSEVHDGQTFTRWSTLYWEKQGKMSIQTRTGNTSKPDEFWSSWSPLYSSNYPYVKIVSPGGRYFQYRVVWQESSAVLKTVRVFYARMNRRPEIAKVEVEIPQENPRNLYRDKVINPIKISWKASDPDGEVLRYHLWYKHSQSDYWLEMTAHTVLTETSFKWDTTHVADGYYLVKLIATDDLVNTTPTSASKILRPILIDNHPPSITAHIEQNEVKGTANDSFSFITQIGYRANAGDWALIPAADGIYDHLEESFRFPLPPSSQGSYTLQIKAMDAAGNTGYVFCAVEQSEK